MSEKADYYKTIGETIEAVLDMERTTYKEEVHKLQAWLAQAIDDKAELRAQRDKAEERTAHLFQTVQKLTAELEDAQKLINQLKTATHAA